MMNGVETGGKAVLIKQMLKQNRSTCEISRKVNASSGYVSHIKGCLKNNRPTHFFQKKYRSHHPEKRNKERKENYDRGAQYDYNSHKKYSKQEEELILKSKKTDRELAKVMSRSVKAIQAKRARMKKESGIIVEDIHEPAIQFIKSL